VFEGDADAVESMLRFCRHGPERAAVERVEEHDEQPEGLEGFRIA
jgi:acylphosphatase